MGRQKKWHEQRRTGPSVEPKRMLTVRPTYIPCKEYELVELHTVALGRPAKTRFLFSTMANFHGDNIASSGRVIRSSHNKI